ncbi:hypothetical protein DMN91_006513 [Ooceraea biroi]|uniref:non-specific protein-tyrosine kinase n=1 Tax=Ooceraea biroi TaxID=2015173 RepID=A0A026WQI1_OOCBI|nr:tyrosine-protein kinase hopscotch [Ooceraea biroi]EZA58280.1 Tyrosine-protein kinase hopscotch [Ooceraea biroi]RLU22133.1 hypothetical protein DMN91_006513 [Ooceraea biroi]
MRDNERLAVVYVATDEKQLNIALPVDDTVEDLCLKTCKLLGIGPVARHLFALRNYSSKLWYPCGHKLESKEKFDFRLRFKPSSIARLKQIDIKAYDYYFQQVRTDIMNNKVPDIIYEKHKDELIGLGVSDMYRVMLEEQLSQEVVESDYKKYIPKECVRRHAFFVKKPIHRAFTLLAQLSGHDASYVKEEYLKQFECMAPNYPYEEYKALMDKGVPNPPAKVLLRVNIEELKYCEVHASNTAWNTLCAIEDLCFISIREDNTVEISRKNGIPSYLKFNMYAMMLSFVSALDGYYRLSVKWTFNLCRNVITPSLERLHKLKCHGPVGAEFSSAKLKEKRANKPGTYVLRESEDAYNVYYIDVCGKDGKVLSQKVEQTVSNQFVIPDSSTQSYESLGQLISSFQNSDNSFCLEECLPPSEYDKSPLLICASENIASEVAADEKLIATLLEGGPRCVPPNQLQIYKAFQSSKSDENLTCAKSATRMHRAMWRVAKGKKLEIAIKLLKSEESKHTKEFLTLTGKWSQLRSSALVRLYGVTVDPSIGMLFELVKLGPLDKYLRSNPVEAIKEVDLVEATTCLATALWHLEDNHVVHGKIRCENVLVHVHTDNSFIVKLADPGLFTYTEADLHWIPPECHNDLESAKSSSQADIWALATTIWEMFSRGNIPRPPLKPEEVALLKMDYQNGKRLPKPDDYCKYRNDYYKCSNDYYKCPPEVYKLMIECWGENGASRKQPQAIMRDINQILYQVYNSRKTHAYATAFPKLSSDEDDSSRSSRSMEDTISCSSKPYASDPLIDNTSSNGNGTDDSTRQLVNPREDYVSSLDDVSTQLSWVTSFQTRSNTMGFNNGSIDNGSADGSSNSSSLQFQNLEMEGFEVILQGRIGQGFYGEVFKGTLEKNGQSIQVAIKKLKSQVDANVKDLEREIDIMKNLKHPNIVEVLGVTTASDGDCLVMEFIKHGSLQSYLKINREIKDCLTHKKLLTFALNIVSGMEYLGCMNIVHRDLAARNILVADENLVKISDFGLAQWTKDDYYILQTNRDLPIKWYAPESLSNGKFSWRSDVWSFGVTMYETFSHGEDPKLPGLNGSEEEGSAEVGQVLAVLEQGTRLPCPPTCPQEVYVKLMNPCWNLQSHERPDFVTLRSEIQKLLQQY